MITPERVTPPPAEPVVANDPPELNEQEKEQLLQDMETTVENFQTQFPSHPSLHNILRLVLQLCQEEKSVVFTSARLVKRFGPELIFYPDVKMELVIRRFFARDYDDNSQSPPVKRIPKNASYTYPGHLTSYMREIVRLIRSVADSDKFPITFNRSPELGKGKQGQPVTFWVVRN